MKYVFLLFFQLNLNKLYPISVTKIVEITYPIYQGLPKDNCGRIMLKKSQQYARGQLAPKFCLCSYYHFLPQSKPHLSLQSNGKPVPGQWSTLKTYWIVQRQQRFSNGKHRFPRSAGFYSTSIVIKFWENYGRRKLCKTEAISKLYFSCKILYTQTMRGSKCSEIKLSWTGNNLLSKM